jgi:hypothetical protein
MSDRLEWLVRFCRLPSSAERMLALLAAETVPSTAALSSRLALEESVVAAELLPSAPLRHWGLVRCDGGRIALNLRIARFLAGA